MLIDLNEKTIKLKEKNKEQTYSLSDIKTWRYDLKNSGKMIGIGITNGIVAKSQNDSNRLKDAKNSGFFISVKDIQSPEWQVRFFPKKGRFSDDVGFRDTELQMKRWMQVFEQVLNKN